MRKNKWRKPYRVKRKKSIFKNRFFKQAILFLLFLIGVFYLICFSSIFQIKEIIISNEGKVSKDDIKQVVEKEIGSIFLLKENNIKETLLSSFPQINKVEIKREFPNVLNIIITERKGLATWCQEQECFLVDEQGIIFEKIEIDETRPRLFLKISKLNQWIDMNLGEQVIEKNLLSQILKIESKLKKELKIDLEEALIVSDKRLNIKTLEKWEVYFNLEEDIDWQITELELILKQDIPEKQRVNLEYIDLRFTKVYYKYK